MSRKMHLYEFKSDKKKLKCLCGWERTVKTSDIASTYKIFKAHLDKEALPVQK